MAPDYRKHYTTPVKEIRLTDCETLIRLALAEDAPAGDPTSESIVSPEKTGEARLVSREEGVLAGMALLPHLFSIYKTEFSGGSLWLTNEHLDGEAFFSGDVLCHITGHLQDILRLERIILNFLQYLSGIATTTANLVKAKDPGLRILDTRKTIPGYRRLAKYAVYCGGGTNHRIHLSDMAMIKDNHVAAAGSLATAVKVLRQKHPKLPLNVEVDSLKQLQELLVLDVSVQVVLLDNMDRPKIEAALKLISESKKPLLVELSGGWTPERLSELEGLRGIGVSMGYLTHTTRFLDLSLEIVDSLNKAQN